MLKKVLPFGNARLARAIRAGTINLNEDYMMVIETGAQLQQVEANFSVRLVNGSFVVPPECILGEGVADGLAEIASQVAWIEKYTPFRLNGENVFEAFATVILAGKGGVIVPYRVGAADPARIIRFGIDGWDECARVLYEVAAKPAKKNVVLGLPGPCQICGGDLNDDEETTVAAFLFEESPVAVIPLHVRCADPDDYAANLHKGELRPVDAEPKPVA